MSAEPLAPSSRLLVVLALIAAVAGAIWAARTPVGPNSDRYDYLGRAHHVLEGQGPRPLVSYPLRFAFDGADVVPPVNATRPPLWPVLVAPGLSAGLDSTAGVWTAAVALLTMVLMVGLAGERSFGPGAGGLAALALATSFATVRALWGGGPELWLALLLMFVWSWNADGGGRGSWPWLGAALAVMPWLHPIGWLYAALGWASRIGRTSATGLAVLAACAVIGGAGWYLTVGDLTGRPFAPLQAHAELAKSLDDAGGLGPYRTLEPVASIDVITSRTGDWLYHTAWNLKEQALRLDGWLAWTLVPFALLGALRDPRLAGRDALLGAIGFAAVSTVAHDPRLLVPLLPIACGWVGAGFAVAVEKRPAWTGAPVGVICAIAPWLLPLGATPVPGHETSGISLRTLDPPVDVVTAFAEVGTPGSPAVTDAAVLAWRARRPAIFLPDRPATLERLRARPGARTVTGLAILDTETGGWTTPEWDAWIESHGAVTIGASRFVDLRATGTAAKRPYVPEVLALGADDVPDSLTTLSVPPAARDGLRVTLATARALDRLVAAAREDAVELRVVSAYRSYERQKALYERAVERHGVDQKWVAAPGTSEHQLGTTVDLADAALVHAVEPSFADTAEGRWVEANAIRFGFVQSYTEANAPWSGYEPEPWHVRYFADLDPNGDAR